MKKMTIILAAAALYAVAACGPAKDQFVVDGIANDACATAEGAVLMLRGAEGKIDTLAIENGKFHYEGTADKGALYTLMLTYPEKDRYDRSHMVSFIPEGGCKLKATIADSSFVNGSSLTDQLLAFQQGLNAATEPFAADLNAAYEADDDEAYDAAYEKMKAAIHDYCVPVIKANGDNAIGVQAFNNIIYDLDADEYEELYAQAGDAVKNDKAITRNLESARAEKKTSVGCMFVDFEGKSLDGKTVKLSDYVGKGNYVLIDFWASWCGPCMNALPELRAVYEKFHKKGVTVLGVNVWETQEGAAEKCVEEKNMTWDIMLCSENKTATDLYGVTGIPTALIFGPDGTIVKRGHPLSIGSAEYFAEVCK